MSSDERGAQSSASGRGIKRREVLAGVGSAVVGLAVGYAVGSLAPKPTVTQTVTTTATTTATATVTATPTPQARAYQRQKIANAGQLRVGQPVFAQYMGQRVVLIKLGEPAIGGVGPDRDIVAFSTACTHMGGPLIWQPETKTLLCTIHYSQFDPARGGMLVVGHASEYLPQVVLEYDEKTGDIYAVGFTALVYGVQDNVGA